MEQLRSTAPGLLGSFGIPPPPAGTNTTSSSTTTTTNNTTTTPNSAQNNPALFSEFMSRMLNGMTTGAANTNLPPEQRYATQLDTLRSMGFANNEANLQGLFKSIHPHSSDTNFLNIRIKINF